MSVVQLSLWDYLDRAAANPAAVDWSGLLAHLDRSLELLPIGEQLATAGEALRRLGEIYGDRSALTLGEIGYLAHPEQEPCLPLAAFDVYVRQSSWVDLLEFRLMSWVVFFEFNRPEEHTADSAIFDLV